MIITVILCTYNRCHLLGSVLASLAVSSLPKSIQWEVLVVDNNSCDKTPQVVGDFACKYPGRFRYLLEPHQGKSYALNAGIREARGDILAFLDDDLVVEPSWLHNLTIGLDGEWAGAGGRTLLAESFTPPKWMATTGPYSLGGVLAALFDLGDKPTRLELPPFGANMAFQKKMFEKYGGFRTDLGPNPDRDVPRPNEDTEFGRRLLVGGERLRYEPGAVAYHPVPGDRLEKNYFLDWHFDWGRALVREWGRGRPILGIPRPYLNMLSVFTKKMVPDTLRWLTSVDPQKRFYSKCHIYVAAGEISEFYRLARCKGQAQSVLTTQKC